MKHLLFSLLLLLLLAGCSSNPLGISDSDWEMMTPEQQHEARLEQARIDEAERIRRAAAAEARRQEELRLEKELAERRANARFGDIVQCTITDAQGRFGSDWRSANPGAFELVRGQTADIEITRASRSSQRARGSASFDGLKVEVCSGTLRCASLVGTEQQFRRGVRQQIDVERFVRGTLTCAFPRGF